MAARRMPSMPVSARVGNYRAPVDTAGMDPEMQKTMHIGTTIDKQASKDNPVVSGLKRMFGVGPRSMKTAAQKSASVKRTSDIPQLSPAAAQEEEQFSAQRKSARVSRTSDIPNVQAGQGIQGGMHKNTGTAGGY